MATCVRVSTRVSTEDTNASTKAGQVCGEGRWALELATRACAVTCIVADGGSRNRASPFGPSCRTLFCAVFSFPLPSRAKNKGLQLGGVD